MQKQKQDWNWKRVFASLRRGYSLTRLFVLAFASAAITCALFVMDEYKPAWVLVAACAVTILFAWIFIRNVLSANTQSADTEEESQISTVQRQSQLESQPELEPAYAVFQSFDEKQRWPEALIVLGLLLFCISLVIPPDGLYAYVLSVVFILSPLVLGVGLISYAIVNRANLATWKKALLGTAALLAGLAFIFLLLFWVWVGGWNAFAHYKYDDNWIVGRSIEEVEARYGEADERGDTIYQYVLYKDTYGLDPTGRDVCYAIFVDENGIVTGVDYDWCPGG